MTLRGRIRSHDDARQVAHAAIKRLQQAQENPFLRGLKGTVRIDPPNILAGEVKDVNVTIPPLEDTDMLYLTPQTKPNAALMFCYGIGGRSTAVLRIHNTSAGPINDTAIVWNYVLIRDGHL